jgi:hypothetical protein
MRSQDGDIGRVSHGKMSVATLSRRETQISGGVTPRNEVVMPDQSIKHGNVWKGGRSQMTNGYIRVWAPGHPVANKDGYALEHRKVLHDAGIEIPPGHHAHHLNHDKADNRLENLAVLPQGEHHSHHIHAAGQVENQYGTYPILPTLEERQKYAKERNRVAQAQRRDRLRRQVQS